MSKQLIIGLICAGLVSAVGVTALVVVKNRNVETIAVKSMDISNDDIIQDEDVIDSLSNDHNSNKSDDKQRKAQSEYNDERTVEGVENNAKKRTITEENVVGDNITVEKMSDNSLIATEKENSQTKNDLKEDDMNSESVSEGKIEVNNNSNATTSDISDKAYDGSDIVWNSNNREGSRIINKPDESTTIIRDTAVDETPIISSEGVFANMNEQIQSDTNKDNGSSDEETSNSDAKLTSQDETPSYAEGTREYETVRIKVE